MQGARSLLLQSRTTGDAISDGSGTRWLAGPMRWAAPAEQNVKRRIVFHRCRVDSLGRPVMRYIDQFVQPMKISKKGTCLSRLCDALETSKKHPRRYRALWPNSAQLTTCSGASGSPRHTLRPHPDLRPRSYAQRGYFAYPRNHYQTNQ
ncbi:carbon starvation induced protein CsiD [Klebsiella pneumoniae]|nr:carbon starvation induced protein CsiD [Klebsiella pneumoniae]